MAKVIIWVMAFAGMAAAEPQPRTWSLHLEYKAILKDIAAGAKRVDLWVPVPHDDAYQQIKNLRIESPYAYRIAPASNGNTMLHVRIDEPKEGTFAMTMSLDAI